MAGISQLWHGLLFGVCRPGIAFLAGSNIIGRHCGHVRTWQIVFGHQAPLSRPLEAVRVASSTSRRTKSKVHELTTRGSESADPGS